MQRASNGGSLRQSIYMTREIPDAALNLLQDDYNVIVYAEKRPIDRETLKKGVESADALICLLSDKIDARIMDQGPRLKVIANYAVGYNNIDIEAARQRKIMVTHTPGVLTNATAELAFALLIGLTRRIISADRFTRQKQFIGWDPLLFLGTELSGKRLAIIGMGRIGQDMAAKCRVFGMTIGYHNRRPLEKSVEERLSATYYGSLEELLAVADVISVHAPLTEKTRTLFNKNTFDKVKPGAYFINTSRGEIVDETALVGALQCGIIKGAGLDVYENEPVVTEALLNMENVILLPHIGSATTETRQKMATMAARNAMAALAGNRPENLVPEMANDW